MKLKVRNQDKVHVIDNLNSTSTIIELKSLIYSLSGISPFRQELKIGYPPRVCYANDEDTLSSVGIQNGEQIILTENSLSETTSQQVNMKNFSGTDIISVPVENGSIILREMEDDNSCLFRAISKSCKDLFKLDNYCKRSSPIKNYVLERSTDIQNLRNMIIKCIKEDPETYSDVVLGKSRDEYCAWIAKKNSWGGAIDYDSIALTPIIDADKEYDQTIFNTSDESILSAVIGISEKMKQLRKYTYTADFTIRCGQCKKGLKGEQEAVQHAKETERWQRILDNRDYRRCRAARYSTISLKARVKRLN
ncbi:5386_t:CDS:2 [Scutellospora calospora]|uniref:5386_t:CDS:1 n=1 Tax=Scutellospora calospora TaxID=85575 RepID=A0ACA9K4F9_9GLOM|nr:5386_t:CDS:2 [Scutellospora calospora]